ncbi:hypothetical protein [Glycomyces arizonensis]|uniref:hypothetical protein n=1 Tax=Glycomyces arizonensis TaxID=256035 RepID=UPI0004047746|nr:hypothetical protein [Glycomyces arizonensis]
MRKNRLLRLVLAATLLGAVSALSFLPHDVDTARVEWTNADSTNPVYPPISPSPSYDGDGTSEPDENGGTDGGDGGESEGAGPEGGGDPGNSDVNDPTRRTSSDAGGLLGLSFPVQAGISAALIALAFLALLPGRRMPENLR